MLIYTVYDSLMVLQELWHKDNTNWWCGKYYMYKLRWKNECNFWV